VFRTFTEFQSVNPVVKAPTFICGDGDVLMDSTLILEYAEALARPRTLMPSDLMELQHDLRLIGLALAACEKSAQIVYERGLRPPEKWHQPWIARVTGQLIAAYRALEQELSHAPLACTSATIRQSGVTVAVAWHFTQQVLAEVVAAQEFPHLVAYSAAAETLPEFQAAPYGDGTYRHVN
jgi:glutathione S-transferase